MKKNTAIALAAVLLAAAPSHACDPGTCIRRINTCRSAGSDSVDILYQGWGFPKSSEVSNYDGDCFPWPSADGRFLFFSSINFAGPPRPGHQGNWDIYVSRWDSLNRVWEEPQNLGPNVNSGVDERCPTCTPDGDTLYFQRLSDIWMTTWDDTAWTPAETVSAPVSLPSSRDEYPALSADGQRLYFTSDRNGGAGGKDLWVALRGPAGWDSVVNVGPPINTPNEETRPFESFDRQRLYFCNNHGEPRPGPSFGGPGDIYVSLWEGDSWGPVHLVAAPVNNDLVTCSPCESPDGRTIWFGSQMVEGSRGDEDIWVAVRDSAFSPGPAHGYGNWQKAAELENAIYIHDLKEGPGNTVYAATSCSDTAPMGRVFRTTDRGATWTACAPLPGAMSVYTLLVSGDTVFAGTYPNGDVFRSTDRGTSWANTAELPLATATRGLERLQNGDILVGASPYDVLQHNPIYRTTDEGASWTETASLSLINPPFFIRQISTGTVFTGGWGIDSDIYLQRSSDNGITWDTVNVIAQLECEWTAHDVLEKSDGALYVCGWIPSQRPGVGGGYVCRSEDDGLTWEPCTKIVRGDGAHSGVIYDLAEDSEGTLFVGMQPAYDSVVFASADAGTTWTSTGGLDGAFECMRLLVASDGTLYAGTTPNGDVFRYVYPGIEELASMPPEVGLSVQAPLGRTVVRFTVPRDGRCGILLFDNAGRQVASLLQEHRRAGRHELTWDRLDDRGIRVPAGNYTLRLRTPTGIASTRVVLLD